MPKHFIPISGKDSLATAFVQTAMRPDLDYQYLFNDTGSELPEVYEWLDKVEQQTGWTIQRTTQTIEALIERQGGFLPSHQARWCTKLCKIKPMDDLFKGSEVFVYYGLRADEPDRTGFVPTRRSTITPVYPLRERGLTLDHVWLILQEKELLPPSFFWPRLHEAVLRELPREQWLKLAPWQERMLFAGRTRSNCFHCFYQRLYEWLWLKETHPEYFLKARAWEKSDYTWNKDHPLSDFDDPAFCEKIFSRRVNALVKILSGQGKEADSLISGVSCGLICGK